MNEHDPQTPPSTGSVLEFLLELNRRLLPILCGLTAKRLADLTKDMGTITMVARRIGEGKSPVPDHGNTDTYLRVECDRSPGRCPAPEVLSIVEFNLSVRLDLNTIGAGHIHVFPTAVAQALRKSERLEIPFAESIRIDAAKVFVSLDAILPYADMQRSFIDKLRAICTTYITRKYHLRVAGGPSSYSFYLAHKQDKKPGTEIVEVPLEKLKALRA